MRFNFGWVKLAKGAAVAAMLCVASTGAWAQIKELRDLGIALSIDAGDVAVSGISSGAAMAQQLHLAHSESLTGAALVAGPPFRCADYFQNTGSLVTREYVAVNLCTAYYKEFPFMRLPFAGAPIDASRLTALLDDAARQRRIDPKAGLCGDRAFLINGGADATVPGHVTDATRKVYEAAFAQCPEGGTGRLEARTVAGMPHTMPTDSVDEPQGCPAGPPYIADCDLEGGEEILRFLHPARASGPLANAPASRDNLIKIDQHRAIGATAPKWLMHRNAYVYVPERCKRGEACALHVALHGCKQNEDQINAGRTRARPYLFGWDAGYNDFAEMAGIVVLYPQASQTGPFGGNPNGCWDWWGYNSPDFYAKDGGQIRNIWKIMGELRKP